jgi:hypothetical protein
MGGLATIPYSQVFIPTLIPTYPAVAGLRIFIGPPTGTVAGYIVANNVPITVPTQFVVVAPLTTTYIYVNLANGIVGSSTTGFTGNVYPIAIVTTNETEVTGLQDVRPNIFGTSGGSGGGATDQVQAITTPQTVTIGLGTNVFATVTSAASPVALPTAVGLSGQTVRFIKTDASGSITITGAVSGTYYLSNQYQYALFESNNVNWYLIGNN